MKKEKSCGAVVFRQNGKEREILLIRHKNGGHWAFPKGHVENQETEEETALREIREETGLSVVLDTGFRRSVTYSPKSGVMKDVVYFAAEYHSGTPTAQPEEVMEIRWVKLEQAMQLVTYRDDKGVLTAFQEYRNG